jgi:hypothetical protein
MIEIRFGKRQRFAGIACVPLAQRIVPTFHVIRLATLFANTPMRFGWKDPLIRFPIIAKGATVSVGFRNLFPKLAARFFTAVPDDKGDYLPGTPAHRGPQPPLVFPRQNERPDFIQLKLVVGLGGPQRVGERLTYARFFFSQTASVCRATPNMRSMPRILGRS